jgi:hypothetical protein
MYPIAWRGTRQQPGEALRNIVFPLLELAVAARSAVEAVRLVDQARPWAIGCSGELWTGHHLSKLPRSSWTILHGVPLDENRDIDHLVVGPAGVFAIDTKVRLGEVTVAREFIHVDGIRTDMLERARVSALATSDALSDAVGWKVWVNPVIAFVDTRAAVRGLPHDVAVLRADNVPRWLESQPRKLFQHRADHIAQMASSTATWLRQRRTSRI